MSIVSDDEFLFYGHDGVESCDRFVSRVMYHALSNGKTRDYPWMADFAATGLRGEAMRWWLGLDDEVQMDWKKLRGALIERYSTQDEPHSLSVSGIPTPAAAPPNRTEARGPEPPSSSELPISHRSSSPPPRGRSVTPSGAWSVVNREPDDSSASIRTPDEGIALAPSNDEPPSATSNSSLTNPTGPYVPVNPNIVQPAARILISEWSSKSARMMASLSFPRSKKDWLQDAKKRRAAYDFAGPGELSSVHWLLVENDENVPQTAIQTGVDTGGQPLYSCRAWVHDGVHPGKCARHLLGAYITFSDHELRYIYPYEVLVGDTSAVSWIANPQSIPALVSKMPPTRMKPFHAIEGGTSKEGLIYLLAQAYKEGHGWQPGKIGVSSDYCVTGWGLNVFKHNRCRILVWA